MRPVHEFQANFSQTASATDIQPETGADGVILHEDDGSVRNLCLVWADGRRAFFNYAYLVSGDLIIQNEVNTLLLSFGSCTVLLEGHRLTSLYNLLVNHIPKIVVIHDSRYVIDDLGLDYIVIYP